jgi:hypothetical protein
MEFLARTAMERGDLPAETNIYEYIAERIHELIPGSTVITESYDEASHHFILQSVKERDFWEGGIELIGRDTVGMAFPVLEHFSALRSESVQAMFGIREYIFRPEEKKGDYSMHELSVYQIPEEICEVILDRFDLGKFFPKNTAALTICSPDPCVHQPADATLRNTNPFDPEDLRENRSQRSSHAPVHR